MRTKRDQHDAFLIVNFEISIEICWFVKYLYWSVELEMIYSSPPELRVSSLEKTDLQSLDGRLKNLRLHNLPPCFFGAPLQRIYVYIFFHLLIIHFSLVYQCSPSVFSRVDPSLDLRGGPWTFFFFYTEKEDISRIFKDHNKHVD